MSHESIQSGHGVVYTLPGQFSDVLRTREFTAFFSDYRGSPFEVRTLDGWHWSSHKARMAEFVATFQSREILDSVIDAHESRLGRLFIDGKVEIDGSIPCLLSVARFTLRNSAGLSNGLIRSIVRLTQHFSKRVKSNLDTVANPNFQFSPCPLELPISFFEPWLGSILAHSCSWHATGNEDFELAQSVALERACSKLELQQGDWMLDLGCGWGSLLLHAAKNHKVRAKGIAACDQQAATVAQKIHSSGLEEICSVECRDIRSQPCRSGEFDKVVHIGVFEQVAATELSDYLRHIRNLLAPGGLLLLHRMTAAPAEDHCFTSLPSAFLSHGISRELQIAEKSGTDVVQLECLSKEYETTLRIWIDRLLNARKDNSAQIYSSGYRVWLLYLIEVAASLEAGETQIYALLLRRRS